MQIIFPILGWELRKKAFKMMKKHLLITLLLLCGLGFLSSCIKDDPEANATVYYGYQKIPNINEFMPQSLLTAFNPNDLHFGGEPPKLEGAYIADSVWITDVILAPGSHYRQQPTSIPTPQYFHFFDQHMGIAKLNFKYPKGNPGEYAYFLERSDADTTFSVVTGNPDHFINDTIAPSYFQNGFYEPENFNTVYIMGTDPYFTIYYYEVRDISSKAQPLNAVIFSGKVSQETIVHIDDSDTANIIIDTIVRPVIENLKWGIETMKYYKEGTSLDQILFYGYLPSKGDVMLLENKKTVLSGDFPED